MAYTISTARRFLPVFLMAFTASGLVLLGDQAISKAPQRIELNAPSVVLPETRPVSELPGNGASLSVDNPANVADYMRYEPYNLFPRELD
ncbi:hypothetical protein, partial [Vampirovibrio sp.]|uniref:hypothetical protein n=1 Tax=Vampirovibrio sp. TaxID=2717857 RepID=UPI00359404AB